MPSLLSRRESGDDIVVRPSKKRKLSALNSKPGKVLDLDSLAWRAVKMPDRLEDVEGFYGLEEIDDVEVVKLGDGTVQYKDLVEDRPPVPQDEAPFEGINEADNGSDEWGGIDDEDLPIEEAGVETESEPKQKRKKPRKEKLTEANAFSVLEEETVKDLADVSAWDSLQLMPETLSALASIGFSAPTEIQSEVIPRIVKGKDVVGKAPTGSGKTLAFGIPILEHFLRHPPRKSDDSEGKVPLAFIVSPTRELAHQLSDHLKALYTAVVSAKDTPQIASITGGLSQQKQLRLLNRADVIIGTPGRLWEIISQGHGFAARLKQIRFLVLDEADRLLSEGHFKELEEILDLLTKKKAEEDEPEESITTEPQHKRQTLVFSATFSKNLQQKLTRKTWKAENFNNVLSNDESMEYLLTKLSFSSPPVFVDVNPIHQVAENITENLIECAALEKDLFLYFLLLTNPTKKTLVFTNSISSVRRLGPFLQNLEIPALLLHSQMIQKARLRSLERFKAQARGGVLIASDVAARGLDIPTVDMIVHYHLPRAADTYIHRSGRTARGQDRTGTSIILCSPDEARPLQALMRQLGGKSSITQPDVDRTLVNRLKPRIRLAKTLADSVLAKEKLAGNASFLKTAAEDLGVELDSDMDMDIDQPSSTNDSSNSQSQRSTNGNKKKGANVRGRGSGREAREQAVASLSKGELKAMRAELKSLLAKRVNAPGVSERYIANGTVDMNALLKQKESGGLGGGFLLKSITGL